MPAISAARAGAAKMDTWTTLSSPVISGPAGPFGAYTAISCTATARPKATRHTGLGIRGLGMRNGLSIRRRHGPCSLLPVVFADPGQHRVLRDRRPAGSARPRSPCPTTPGPSTARPRSVGPAARARRAKVNGPHSPGPRHTGFVVVVLVTHRPPTTLDQQEPATRTQQRTPAGQRCRRGSGRVQRMCRARITSTLRRLDRRMGDVALLDGDPLGELHGLGPGPLHHVAGEVDPHDASARARRRGPSANRCHRRDRRRRSTAPATSARAAPARPRASPGQPGHGRARRRRRRRSRSSSRQSHHPRGAWAQPATAQSLASAALTTPARSGRLLNPVNHGCQLTCVLSGRRTSDQQPDGSHARAPRRARGRPLGLLRAPDQRRPCARSGRRPGDAAARLAQPQDPRPDPGLGTGLALHRRAEPGHRRVAHPPRPARGDHRRAPGAARSATRRTSCCSPGSSPTP